MLEKKLTLTTIGLGFIILNIYANLHELEFFRWVTGALAVFFIGRSLMVTFEDDK